MADNYLEKRMEDYRSGAAARRRPAGMRQPKMPLEGVRVIVAAKTPCVVDGIVRKLRGVGASVNLWSATDGKCARDLAWSCGATFHPCGSCSDALEQAVAMRGNIDVVVMAGVTVEMPGAVLVSVGSELPGAHYIDDGGLGASAVAAAVAALCDPALRDVAPLKILSHR